MIRNIFTIFIISWEWAASRWTTSGFSLSIVKWRMTGLKITQLNTMRTKMDLCIQQVVWWILNCCKTKQLHTCRLATSMLHKHYAAYNCHQMIIALLKTSIHSGKHAWITETGVSRAISSDRAAFLSCLRTRSWKHSNLPTEFQR